MENHYLDLAQRLECAFVSHRLRISMSYCMRTYIVDRPVSPIYYQLAIQLCDLDIKLAEVGRAAATAALNDGPA